MVQNQITTVIYGKGAHKPSETAHNSQSWNNSSYKISKVVLNYNPKYRIGIIEPILIQIGD